MIHVHENSKLALQCIYIHVRLYNGIHIHVYFRLQVIYKCYQFLLFPLLHIHVYILQKMWREQPEDFKKRVARCVRKSQDDFL